MQPATNKIAAAVALALGVLASPGNALELGEIKVRSALGERLVAELPIGADDAGLSPDCFSVRSDTLLEDSNIVNIRLNGRSLLIQSNKVVTEPIVMLSVTAKCNSLASLRRDYTLFINPPNRVSSAQRAALRLDSAPTRDTMPAARQRIATTDSSRPRKTTSRTPINGARYEVQQGDSVSAIAMRMGAKGADLWPTVKKIVAENPDAFINGDADRLLAGAVLALPVALSASLPQPVATTTTNVAPIEVTEPPTVSTASPSPDEPPPATSMPVTQERVALMDAIAESDAELASVREEIAALQRQLAIGETPTVSDSPFVQAEPEPIQATPAAVVADSTVNNAAPSSWGKFFAFILGGASLLVIAVLWRMQQQARSRRQRQREAAQWTPARAERPRTHRTKPMSAAGARRAATEENYFVREDDSDDKLTVLDHDFSDDVDQRTDNLTLESTYGYRSRLEDAQPDATAAQQEDAWLVENTDRFEIPSADISAQSPAPFIDEPTAEMPRAEAADRSGETTIDEQSLEMLAKDYEHEFTRTQQLEKALAQAALASGIANIVDDAKRAGEPVNIDDTVEQIVQASTGDTTQTMPPEELRRASAEDNEEAIREFTETIAEEDATLQMNADTDDLGFDITSTFQADIDDIAETDDEDGTEIMQRTGIRKG